MKPITRHLTIGVTGGQGVGKTTFCDKLAAELRTRSRTPVSILPSIGETLRIQGIALGSAANGESVLAIYAAHLERTRRAARTGIEIMDRCAVDALCYTRALEVNSILERILLREISHLMAERLDFVIHLRMEGIFADSKATHETPELRRKVATMFDQALIDVARPFCSIYAADTDAVTDMAKAIMAL